MEREFTWDGFPRGELNGKHWPCGPVSGSKLLTRMYIPLMLVSCAISMP